ncbi:MAG: tetratricopeptide repeat protein [Flavipsychrobacter sp.]|nr:tetratricopeptide repeat protein [Flavipsychrobacter sp.]
MKKLIFISLLILGPALLWAQKVGQARIDSLLQELPKAKVDTNKVKLLARLSFTYYTINPEEGLKYANKQLELANQLGWEQGVERAYSNMAINYMAFSNYPKSLEYEFITLKKSRDIHNKDDEETALENIGITYRLQRNFNKALEYQLKSLKLCEEMGYKIKIANNLGNIGDVYWALGNQGKALEYSSKALAMSEALNDKKNIAKNLGNIGNIYDEKKQYSKALDYDFRALKIYEEIGDKYGTARNLGNIGELYVRIVTDTAHTTLPDSLIPVNRSARLEKGIAYLNKGINASREISYRDATMAFMLSLSEAYQADGNYKSALKSYRKYIDVKDSVFSNENNQKIKELENKQVLDIKEKDIQLAQLAVAKKRNERGFYLAGIVVLILIIGLVLKSNRAQRKINNLLGKEKIKSDGLMQNLEASLQQKEVLMKEIHHRVKNNLQVISNLLELQGHALDDKVAKAAIAVGQGRVKSIGLIHQKLYQNEDITKIELHSFLEDLYSQVAMVFTYPGQDLDVQFDVPEIILDIDTAIPLGLIINELLTNAFKYAFRQGEKGILRMMLSRDETYFLLQVRDNGPGLPVHQNLKSFSSLGMKLISRLSKQLGGYTEYKYDNGSIFNIFFKDVYERKKVL